MRQLPRKIHNNRRLKKNSLATGLVVAAIAMMVPIDCAHAATFAYSGSIVQYTIPTTGTYTIDATGAAGAGGYEYPSFPDAYAGGLGAEIVGTFTLTAGTTLDILVGGKGEGAYYGGAGGGGSFVVVDATQSPLVVAGGGGGGGYTPDTGAVMTGGNGLTTTSGGNSIGTNGVVQGNGGTGGSGGSLGIGYDGGAYDAGAGGGFSGDGANGYYTGGGMSYLNGGAGGAGYDNYSDNGGFGGGGGAGYYGAGGGGGYSGGAGSDATNVSEAVGAGGGGSYFDASGSLVSAVSGVGTDDGNGVVTITPVSVPEPAAITLLGVGALPLLGRRRRKAL